MSITNKEIHNSLFIINSAFLTSAVSQSLRLIKITNKFIFKDSAVTFAVQFVINNFSILSKFNTAH